MNRIEAKKEMGLWLEEQLGGRLVGKACYNLAGEFVDKFSQLFPQPLDGKIEVQLALMRWIYRVGYITTTARDIIKEEIEKGAISG